MNIAEKCDTIENENPNNRRNPLVANNVNVKKLEADLWESADLLRAGSKLTSNQYCMPVLGLIFLRYAYSRFKLVEQEILKDRPVRGGRVLPVEQSDFAEKSALFLPKEAQYNYLVNLPANIPEQGLTGIEGNPLNSLGEVVNNAMELVEQQSEQLQGVLPKDYTIFSDELLGELLRIFNNDALDDVGGDVIGRIYEYFLNKFAKNVAQDDGVFFTPKSLVKMIVNVLEPAHGVLLDPACGSGGMFVQTGDFVNHAGMIANNTMTFYGQEKVEYNAKLCLMNMAVHGLTGVIKSGDEANTFYHDAHNLNGCCDYVMANPPFNVDKVKSESAQSAGRLPFGLPGVNKAKEIGNANYLWVSYFYSYLNEHGRAGFVMASSATDSQGKDKDIREKLYFRIKANNKLDKNGKLTGQFTLTAEGQSDLNIRRIFTTGWQSDWKNSMESQLLSISPKAKLLKVDWSKNPKDYQAAPIKITFWYEIPDYAIIGNDEMALVPLTMHGLYDQVRSYLRIDTDIPERQYGFKDGCSRLLELDETIQLPQGYRLVQSVEDNRKSPAADFEGYIRQENNKIDIHQKLALKKRVYEAGDWNGFRTAVNAHKAFGNHLIINK